MKHIKPKDIDDVRKEYSRTREVLDLFNSWVELEKMNEYRIYRNLEKQDLESLIDTFNKYDLFEVVYFSTLEGLYNTENYYVCYNPEERRFESFDSLECINQVEEFETLLNLIKRGVKHE